MKKSYLKIFTNLQILSALIWAATILSCSFVSDKSYIPTIIGTAAGFHVVLMTRVKSVDLDCRG